MEAVSHGALPDSRAALQAEPARLQEELQSLQTQIQTLVLDNFKAHVSSFRCEADVRKEFEAGQAFAVALSDGIAQATTSIDSLEAPLGAAHAQHGRLRRTLGHQSNILEVLEAPALMETCLRAGLYDEALDIAEYATSLYFAHKLWLPSGSAAAGGTQPNAAGSKVVRTVVAEIRRSCDELQETLVRALSTKIGLPQALQLLGHLRRLFTQQALARRRVAAAAHAHAQHELALTAAEAADGTGLRGAATDRSLAPPAARVASAFDFSLPDEEEAAIVDRLIAVFLSCRDAWHRGELDFISRHNAYNYIVRVIETQRSQWADISAQYSAVATSLLRSLQQRQQQRAETDAASPAAPGVAYASAAAAESAAAASELQTTAAQLRARTCLVSWLRRRIAWFVDTLAASVPLLEDDAGRLLTVFQQAAYAARRAGRLGCDYSHLIAPVFAQQAVAILTSRIDDALTAFGSDLAAWEWAYKAVYEPEGRAGGPAAASAAPSSAVAGLGGAAAAGGDAAALPVVAAALPTALLRHPPLASLANHVFAACNTLRPFFPDACADALAHTFAAVAARVAAQLQAALAAEPSPLLALPRASAAAAAGRKPGVAASSATGGSPAARRSADEHVQALQRFDALCAAVPDAFGGCLTEYLAQVHAGAGLLLASSPLLSLLHGPKGDAAAASTAPTATAGGSVGTAFSLDRLRRMEGASLHLAFDAARADAAKLTAALRERIRGVLNGGAA